jgi:hypothetical protein
MARTKRLNNREQRYKLNGPSRSQTQLLPLPFISDPAPDAGDALLSTYNGGWNHFICKSLYLCENSLDFIKRHAHLFHRSLATWSTSAKGKSFGNLQRIINWYNRLIEKRSTAYFSKPLRDDWGFFITQEKYLSIRWLGCDLVI